MYQRTYKPSIQVQDSYDKVYGQRNHRNYTNLQKRAHRQMYPELYLDDVELYDKHMYKKYLFEEAADVEAKEEFDKHHKQQTPIHEIMLQITMNNQAKTKQLLDKIKVHSDAKKEAKKAKQPDYLQIFQKFNQPELQKKNVKCKECESLGLTHAKPHSNTPAGKASTDLIATLIKRKNHGK